MNRAILFFPLLLLFFLSSPALLEAKKSVSQQINEEERALKKINKELSSLTSELKLLKRKEESNLKRLEVIKKRQQKFDRQLRKYTASQLINRQKSRETEKQINKLRAKSDKQREKLKSRLRALYKQSSMSDLELLFTSKGIKTFMKNRKYLERLSHKDIEQIDKFSQIILDLKELQIKLANENNNIRHFKNLSLEKKNDILEEKKKKQVAIKDIKKAKDYYFTKKKNLERAGKQVMSLITTLSRKKEKVKKQEKAFAYKNFAKIKGKMPWPVEGKVLTHFGKEKNEVFGTYIYHNGIEIVSRKDTTVRSVFKGKVLFSGVFENFGNMVVVSHGKGYYSLYAYLKKSFVKVGESVEGGEKIASIGENQKVSKPTLYFEIRKRGDAINPEKWLR